MRRFLSMAALFSFAVVSSYATPVSFTGSFAHDDEVQFFVFSLTAQRDVTIQTWSYGGGWNATGNWINPGGFDTVVSLFAADGTLLLVNDDGGCAPGNPDPSTGNCFDSTLEAILPAGSYLATLTQNFNFPNGPTLADGFSQAGSGDFTCPAIFGAGAPATAFCDSSPAVRNGQWALDIVGADSAAEAPEPSTFALVGIVPLFVLLRRRSIRAVLAVVASVIPAMAIDLPVQQDAYVNSTFSSTNFGGAPTLNVDSTSGSYIQFDLSEIYASVTPANLRKATLRLYVSKMSSPGQVNVSIAGIAWNESTVTWNNQPNGWFPAQASFSVSKANSWVSADVTLLVSNFLTSQSTNGFGLGSGGNGVSVSFDSKENTATGHAPVLEIEYLGSQPTGTGMFNTAFGVSTLNPASSANSNSAFGAYALSQVSTGSENTAVGASALYNNTTGFQNTAVGSLAAAFNTTGYNNTALGKNALVQNQTGNNNTALGVSAMSNVKSNDNTAVGVNALDFFTTGAGNTAVGTNAMVSNQAYLASTTGSYNTAVGYNSLGADTTGENNVAVGANALSTNQSGFSNVAIGNSALLTNQSGTNNIAVGMFGLKLSTGHNNIAMGQAALLNLTSGNTNIAIGLLAGTTLQTGSQNIYIGADSASPSETGKIRIGSSSQNGGTYIAGISGVAVSGVPVVVGSDGKLGVAPSSARYKQEIEALPDLTDALMQLRPVTYRYITEAARGNQQLEYGLIAEEVAKVLPNLVIYDQQGRPDAVLYQKLNALLLDQFQRQQRRMAEMESRLGSRLDALEGALERK